MSQGLVSSYQTVWHGNDVKQLWIVIHFMQTVHAAWKCMQVAIQQSEV